MLVTLNLVSKNFTVLGDQLFEIYVLYLVRDVEELRSILMSDFILKFTKFIKYY